MTFPEPTVNHTIDGGAALAVAMTIAGFLPPVAAVLAAVWYMVQIYESKTVQTWVHNHRLKVNARKLARLEAKKVVILAEIDAAEKVRIAKDYGAERVKEARADAASGMKLQALTERLPESPAK